MQPRLSLSICPPHRPSPGLTVARCARLTGRRLAAPSLGDTEYHVPGFVIRTQHMPLFRRHKVILAHDPLGYKGRNKRALQAQL